MGVVFIKSLSKVLIKILSIWFITRSLYEVNGVIISYMSIKNMDQQNISLSLLYLISPLISIIIGVVLWCLAEKIADKAVGKLNEEPLLKIDVTQLQNVSFIIIGIVLIIDAASGLTKGIFQLLALQNMNISQLINYKADIIEDGIILIFAILLIIGRKGIISMIKRLKAGHVYKSPQE